MAESRNFALDTFDSIDVATGLHAIVSRGDTQTVRAESDRDGQIDQIDLKVRHGKLVAKRNTNLLDIILSGGLLNMFGKDNDVTIYITVPSLEGIEASSGANVDAAFLNGPHPHVASSSGANVAVEDADAGRLNLASSSGASITLSGKCDAVDLAFSSGARIAAGGLTCEDINVDGSSGGSAEVTATGKVTGSVSSGAHVRLHGAPNSINVQSSSGGGVSLK